MLDTKSKQILSYLKPYALQNPIVQISSDTITENIPQSNINEIENILKFLREQGYLVLKTYVSLPIEVFKVNHQGIYFDEFEQQDNTPTQTFNIGSVTNSAFGNNGNTTINNGYNFEEIRSLIASKPIEDQPELNKFIDRIEIITEDNQPVSKGTFAKFSDLLSKHSDIITAIAPTIMNWLLSVN